MLWSVLLQVRQIQPVQFQHHPSSDMERKQYLDQIKELVQTVQTLLDANIALGNKQKELQAEADCKIAGLQAQVDKLTGELQARRRKMHGNNNEKQIGDKSVNTGKELMAYTKIGSVLIDNNCCERAVRPFTNLRKNFGGFSSEQGARVTATFLTFVETCKLMATAPLDFFRGFFDMIVAGRRDYALMTEVLLVKPVKKSEKSNFLKYTVSPVKIGLELYCHRGWMLTILMRERMISLY